jgi:4-amino-4-deoxy-L-arabinose transferase-like glycosyltransferase
VPRLIEIVLFLVPFVGFATWRLLFPQPLPPVWLMGGLAGFAVLMFVALLWLRQMDAEDANRPYVPAELHDGRIVTPTP